MLDIKTFTPHFPLLFYQLTHLNSIKNKRGSADATHVVSFEVTFFETSQPLKNLDTDDLKSKILSFVNLLLDVGTVGCHFDVFMTPCLLE